MEHSEIISLQKHGTKEDSPLKQEKETNKTNPSIITQHYVVILAHLFVIIYFCIDEQGYLI